MFILDDMRSLLSVRPFVPFRLYLSDGGTIDVRTPEVVLTGRRFALVGLLDPDASDTSFDRYMTLWYMHVTRYEMLSVGPRPFGAPPSGSTESPTPSPA